jgi:Co/Zn/Cd efflux system component
VAEQTLATRHHRWFARATVLAALASGVTLLLPWTFSRRLGESVWQLGLETQPSLLLTWLAGLITSIVALTLRPGPVAQTCTAITGVIALIYIAGGWQANTLDALSDSWPGPGPAFAIVTGLCWLLCVSAQLVADRPHPSNPTDEALRTATTRLRHTR